MFTDYWRHKSHQASKEYFKIRETHDTVVLCSSLETNKNVEGNIINITKTIAEIVIVIIIFDL